MHTLKPSRGSFLAVAVLCVSIASLPQALAVPVYTVVDLGTLGGQYSAALGLNQHGAVVGQASDISGVTRAFVAQGAPSVPVGPLAIITSDARAINSSGAVIGTANASSGAFGYVWRDGVTTQVPPIAGGSPGRSWRTYANDINDAGWVVGASSLPSGPVGNLHAVHLRDGAVTDLGTLGGTQSQAYGINASGQIVGAASLAGDTGTRAFLWSNGDMISLGTLGAGTFSIAWDISDSGYITGWSATNKNSDFHALLHTDSMLNDLGTLGGSRSIGYGVNNTKQVVGVSTVSATDFSGRAFLHLDGSMYDLNDLISSESAQDWFLYEARAINDAGQIVGIGALNGVQRAYLLNPVSEVPEPSSLVLVAASLLLLLRRSLTLPAKQSRLWTRDWRIGRRWSASSPALRDGSPGPVATNLSSTAEYAPRGELNRSNSVTPLSLHLANRAGNLRF